MSGHIQLNQYLCKILQIQDLSCKYQEGFELAEH